MLKLGSHVKMSGKEMLLGSAKEAIQYNADTFMFFTGAPQNTRRKEVSELRIDEAWDYITEHGLTDPIVHAPYIINLGNTIKPETYELAVEFLQKEVQRTEACRSKVIVLHPGAHVGAGEKEGLSQIIRGLNQIITREQDCVIALETMAGKGSELGKTFEELAAIYDGVIYNDKLRVCFDTCHVHDAGYDLIHELDSVLDQFDSIIGKDQIAVFHINDSKNECGTAKDKHANIGFGKIGFDPLCRLIHHPDFEHVPKILETPYIKDPENIKKTYAPYKEEIEMLRSRCFDPLLAEHVIEKNRKGTP